MTSRKLATVTLMLQNVMNIADTLLYFFFKFGATAPPPPPVGQVLFIHEVSRSHTQRRTRVDRTPLDA